MNNISAIVLAAGKGTRMGSSKPKVLHEIDGKPMIEYTLDKLDQLKLEVIVVVGYEAEQVKSVLGLDRIYAVQENPAGGTGDAVKTGLSMINPDSDTILVLNGDDSAFYKLKTLKNFLDFHLKGGNLVSAISTNRPQTERLGRVIRDKDGNFKLTMETWEYEKSGLSSDEVLCGVYVFQAQWLNNNIDKIDNNNDKKEYRITETLNIAHNEGTELGLFKLKDPNEWIGINTPEDLEKANRLMRGEMKIHFMGMVGSGASAAAAIAKNQGFEVSGCDLTLEGHSPKHLNSHMSSGNVDILAITPAVLSFDPDNPEVAEAKKIGIPVMTWQEFTGKYLLKDKFVIAVSGTHGKSTTTAMIAKIIDDAGLNPTVLLGATLSEWGTNFRVGNGKYFIIEADEAYDNFLNYIPNISVITNIEMDHPEYFKDLNAIMESFEKFLLGTKQTVVANLSDPSVADVIKVVMKTPSRQLLSDRGKNVQYLDYSKSEFNLKLQIPGEFNKLNAKAAFQVGLLLGIDPGVIRKSLSSFTGVSRRFEHLGNYKGREVYSDFGHHPTEVKTTMEAARKKFPNKYIWLIYQPHMFSRTKALFKEFVEVFKNLPVNQALILDIYPSREVNTGLVSSKELVNGIDSTEVDYIAGLEELKDVLNKEVRQGDIIFFMGAGDIDQMARKLLSLV